MRKRNFLYYIDTIFWWVVYSLPVIILIIASTRHFSAVVTNPNVFGALFAVLENSPIHACLTGFFGTAGVLPLWDSDSVIFLCATWFCSAILIHIVVDIIVFLPRIFHNFIDFLTKRGKDNE